MNASMMLAEAPPEGQHEDSSRNGKVIRYAEDLKLAQQARAGNDRVFEQLRQRFDGILRYVAHRYFIYGGDHNDVYQVALLALLEAVNDYDGSSSSLKSFVTLCVKRRVIDAATAANRPKYQLLNHAARFGHPYRDDQPLEEQLEDLRASPSRQIEDRAYLAELLHAAVCNLSELERNVLYLWLADYSYDEIADCLGTHNKAVNNALQRARYKLRQATESWS